ncbi:MAG: hypothetical protein AAGF93_03945 [Cyanobacteria bacterium P01_H01_bin.105]
MNLEHLYRHWLRAEEEDEPENAIAIYRALGSVELPVRRFRMQYIFHADGRCEWYSLASDCQHCFKPGSWQLDPTDDSLLYICQAQPVQGSEVIRPGRSQSDPPRGIRTSPPQPPASGWLNRSVEKSCSRIVELTADRLALTRVVVVPKEPEEDAPRSSSPWTRQ